MAIVISGTTGIDAGSLPVSNCGNTEVEGNLNLSGTGARITGDFSNATVSNRTIFQTSTANSSTGVYFIPNTLSGSAAVRVTNSSDTVNFNSLEINANQSVTALISNFAGTASALPLTFITNNAERMRIDTAGNVGIGTGSPSSKLHTSSGAEATGVVVQSNTSGSSIGFIDNTSTNWYSNTIGVVGNDLVFKTATNERMRIDASGNVLLKSGAGGLGYGTGAGGTVTQLTSKSTAVTLNKPSGQIVMNNAALAAGAIAEFQFSNTLISATDTLILNCNGFVSYRLEVRNILGGSAIIRVTNISGGNLSEALIINFNLIKGAQS